MPNFFKKFFAQRGPDASRPRGNSKARKIAGAIRRKLPVNLSQIKFDPSSINLDSVQQHSGLFRFGLTIIAVFLASGIASRIIGTYFIRPAYTPLPPKKVVSAKASPAQEDFTSIENRNIFNVENKIPEPFDQGLLDCFSQAKPSGQRVRLLGTIVMTDEALSVALIEEDGSANKVAVKKEDSFGDGKYQALKVERKRFCFQVKQSQELEYVEIPDEGGDLTNPMAKGTEGITKVGESNYAVKQTFLENQLKDLNNVLQTAKAVPYTVDNKMKGFLIQSIDPDSPFASLGINQGDVLVSANDVVFDNLGKGLEAFQLFRNARRIEIRVLRGGQEIPLSYDVK